MGGLEGLQLQLDGDQPAQVAVEEEQVEVKIVLADAHALLPGDEGEASAQLQQDALDLAQDGALEVALAVGAFQSQKIEEIGITKDGIGRHAAIAEVGDFCGDDRLGVLRQRGALEQHAADLLPERAHIPALDAAHLGVEVAGERVFDGEEFHEMDQLPNCCDSVTTIASSGNN